MKSLHTGSYTLTHSCLECRWLDTQPHPSSCLHTQLDEWFFSHPPTRSYTPEGLHTRPLLHTDSWDADLTHPTISNTHGHITLHTQYVDTQVQTLHTRTSIPSGHTEPHTQAVTHPTFHPSSTFRLDTLGDKWTLHTGPHTHTHTTLTHSHTGAHASVRRLQPANKVKRMATAWSSCPPAVDSCAPSSPTRLISFVSFPPKQSQMTMDNGDVTHQEMEVKFSFIF